MFQLSLHTYSLSIYLSLFPHNVSAMADITLIKSEKLSKFAGSSKRY